MSTSNFSNHEKEHQIRRNLMNGTRPSPLKITKDSHFIQKQHQKRQPLIIYTHSPKIIHTQARDFMALVQKLTGMSQSDDEMTQIPSKLQNRTDQVMKGENNDDNEWSSIVTEENCGNDDVINGVVDHNVKDSYSCFDGSSSPIINLSHPYLADIPVLVSGRSRTFPISPNFG